MEDRALVPSGIVVPLVSVSEAVEHWKTYIRLCDQLLDKSDYQTIRGRKFRKKSGWRKLARAFNITDTIVDKEIVLDQLGRVLSARFVVRAIAPNGRTVEAWGSCSLDERAHIEDKEDRYGNVCPGPCDGRKHYSNPNHDIPATAHTRAKNRGISDLIGAGEVSAEEIEAGDLGREGQPESKAKAPSKRKAKRKAKPKLATSKPKINEKTAYGGWNWLRAQLTKHGISEAQGPKILGHPSIKKWIDANPGMTQVDALREILAVSGTEPLPGTFAEPAPAPEPRPEPVSGEQIEIDEIPY